MADPIVIVKEGSLEITIRVPGGGGCDSAKISPNGDEVVVTFSHNDFKIEDGSGKRFREVERGNKTVRIERA